MSQAQTTLDAIGPGETVSVARLEGPEALTTRLYAMGVWPGVEVTRLRRAPLGDPTLYRLQGYRLALRKHEARCIFVAPIGTR
ncbi:MAG: ferrous iron transport protein A [Myxococcota bacterium]|jgi:ferrous iron transport protein A